MTQPTTIFFGPDDKKSPKIYLRTLLFSTSQRGRIIESMYVKLTTKERTQIFNIWVYGERAEIVRGSGLFVGGTGVAFNHHFLMPKHGEKFEFLEGNYELKVYASLLNEKKSMQLFAVNLNINEENADKIKDVRNGIYFDWDPELRTYQPYLHHTPFTAAELFEKLQ